MFERLAAKKKSEHVAEQIIGAIEKGTLGVGDKLPPEDELARAMGVSRPSVREALGALRLVGVLQTKVGNGTYISHSLQDAQGKMRVSSQLFSLLKNGENPFEALEARRALECTIIKYATERRTEDDLATIESALKRIVACIDKRDFDAMMQADMDFHIAIGWATQNTVLGQAVKSLVDLMDQSLWPRIKKELLQTKPQHIDETLRAHQEIFEAIREQDARKALASLEMHFDDIELLFQ